MCGVDGGYSHEFTTAQVHHFLQQEFGPGYRVVHPDKLAVFEDHLLYADGVPRMAPFAGKIGTLRRLQTEFMQHTGVRDYQARDGISPGICHEVARRDFIDPGDFIQATDSHTCMGGGNDALAWGVGATEYAALIASGSTFVQVPESIRFELRGRLPPECTAKDVILWILAHHAREELTLDRVMEFGGPGLATESLDEPAVARQAAMEHLQRHLALEHGIGRAIDLAHPPGGDTIDHVVAAVERGQGEREIRADGPLRNGALRDGRLPMRRGRCGRTSRGPGRVRARILACPGASTVEAG